MRLSKEERHFTNVHLLIDFGHFDNGTAETLALQFESEIKEYGHSFRDDAEECSAFIGFIVGAATMRDLQLTN